MRTIINDIKDGRLKKAYLLFGEEVYLRNVYKNKLLKAMNPDGDTMNFAVFQGKNIVAKEIIDLAETMPFFADYRTILIEDTNLFKSSNEELCNYFKKGPCETTRFIFSESEVDKRSSFYKIIKEYGNAVEFKTQDDEALKKWVAKLLADNNLRITGSTADYLLVKTGNDMGNINSEIEKLSSYAFGKTEVTKEDIDAIVTPIAVNRIFDMMDAIADRQQTSALNMYYDLIALKEEPIGILAMIERHFNKLIQIKDLRQRGYGNIDIANKVSINKYYIGKYIKQASCFEMETLIDALDTCVSMDDSIKKGLLDKKMAVEMIICKYSE